VTDKLGQLTMEYEILRAAAETRGSDPAGEAARIPMEHQVVFRFAC
jgi:hypothetical protein